MKRNSCAVCWDSIDANEKAYKSGIIPSWGLSKQKPIKIPRPKKKTVFKISWTDSRFGDGRGVL